MMTRLVIAAFVASNFLGLNIVTAQQSDGQQGAVGAAAVRTRQGAPTISLDQHQSPIIAVLYGPQQTETRITAFLSHEDQPQQDKEIVFDRESAAKRIIAHEGEQPGQPRRLVFTARRGQDDAQIEPLVQTDGVMIYGVRRPEPKVAKQSEKAAPAKPEAAAAAPEDPAQAAELAAARQKQADAEAKRKAAEPKPDKYEAIITVYLTTGR